MKTLLVSVGLLLCVVGCGREKEPLEGAWVTNLEVGDCTLGFSFDGSHVEQDRICTLPNGSVGLEATIGTYVVSGGRVTLNSTHSSCPKDVRESATFEFEPLGATLLLTRAAETGTRVYGSVSNLLSSSAGVVTFGCFDDNFNFVPDAVRLLP